MSTFSYPYLVSSVVLFAIFVLGLWLRSSQRNLALLSGACSIPCCLSTFLFVPEYWNPVRLFDLPLGIEDLMFSFSTGGIAWLLAGVEGNQGLKLSGTAWGLIGRRYVMACLLGLLLMVATRLSVQGAMNQVLVGMAIAGIVLSADRWRLLPVAMRAGGWFGLIYMAFLAVMFRLFPTLTVQWNWDNLSGHAVLALPLEEVVFGFAFGVTWTIVMLFVLDIRRARVYSLKSSSSR